MANKTIPELQETTSPNSEDVLIIHGSGLTQRVKLQNILPIAVNSNSLDLSINTATRQLSGAVKLNSVDNSKLSDMGGLTIKGRKETSSGAPQDITINELSNLLLSSTLLHDISSSLFENGIVTSVNGLTGIVQLTAQDLGAATQFHTHSASDIFLLPFFHDITVTSETTILSTGDTQYTFRMPANVTLTDVRASLTTASSSSGVEIDINQNGSSILAVKLSIDESEKTSRTSSSPVSIAIPSISDDDEITIDIDSAGSGATGLKMWFIGTL